MLKLSFAMKVRILWISAPLSVLMVFVLDSMGCREKHGILHYCSSAMQAVWPSTLECFPLCGPRNERASKIFGNVGLWKLFRRATSHFLSLSHYKGVNDKDAQPLAFVGKGVTFDSGGISLKPGAVCLNFLTYRHSLIIRNPGHEIDAWRYGQVCNQGTCKSIDPSIFLGGAASVVSSAWAIAKLKLPWVAFLFWTFLISSYRLPQYQSCCQHSPDRKHARTKCH